MPFKNNTQCLYFLSIALFVSQSNIVHAASLDILSFQKTAFSKLEQTQVCQQIQQLCDNQQQWRSLKSPDQKLWLLSGDNIATFQHTKTGLKLLASWHVNVASQQDTMSNQPFIFPKLFPMAKHRYAIALIHPFSEMYSGGGASIERADFYELQSNGTTRQFIKNYPFSFNRMIRACFSAEDYEQSDGLCHDEDGLSLDIRPIKPMHWQFRYQYGLSVSPTSDSGEKSHKDRRNINIDLNRAPSQPNIPTTWNYAGQE